MITELGRFIGKYNVVVSLYEIEIYNPKKDGREKHYILEEKDSGVKTSRQGSKEDLIESFTELVKENFK
jgi:hypothetical protein